MKYLILENDVWDSRGWKIIDSELSIDEFIVRCGKYAVYHGDAFGEAEIYKKINDGDRLYNSVLKIINIDDLTIHDVDIPAIIKKHNEYHEKKEAELELAIEKAEYERLKLKFGGDSK